jgi:hypothetical protein
MAGFILVAHKIPLALLTEPGVGHAYLKRMFNHNKRRNVTGKFTMDAGERKAQLLLEFSLVNC